MGKALLVALLLLAPWSAFEPATAASCAMPCEPLRIAGMFRGSTPPPLLLSDGPPPSVIAGANADGTSWRITYFPAFYASEEDALANAQLHLDAALRAYANQTSWGLQMPDPDGVLDITLDGCDCIFAGADADIHMFPRVGDLYAYFPELAYRSDAELAEIIVAHELFHHVQYGYQAWNLGDWLVEGMARFIETISVPDGAFLPTTLTYAADGNGFNAFMLDPARPLMARSYDSALLWGWLYAHEGGIPLLKAVLEESAGATGDPRLEGPAAIQRAMDRVPGGRHDTFEESYRAFARALLMGEDLTWAAPSGAGSHDWATYLLPVARSQTTVGPFQLRDWGIRVHDAKPMDGSSMVTVSYAGAPVYAATFMTRAGGETTLRDAAPSSFAMGVDDAALMLVRLPAPAELDPQAIGVYAVVVRY